MAPCARCGGTSDGSTLVCRYCGNPLVNLATVEEELQALNELGQVAAAIGQSIGSGGGLMAVYTAAGDRIARDQKLTAFWQNAFIPKHPAAQVYAIDQCIQQVSPYGGELGELMVHRATMIFEALKTKATADAGIVPQLPRLAALIEGAKKRKGAQTRTVLWVLGGVFGAMIFLVLLVAVLAGRHGASGGAAAASGGGDRTLKCKFTGSPRTVHCAPGDADACSKLPAEVLCRDKYQDALQGRINNWVKDGAWSGHQNKITWIDLAGTMESHDGKQCAKASLDADVWLCPAAGVKVAGHVTGYGKMTRYDEGVVTDDLDVEVLAAYDAAAASQERVLRELAQAGSDKGAIEAWMAGPGSKLDPDVVRTELLAAGVSRRVGTGRHVAPESAVTRARNTQVCCGEVWIQRNRAIEVMPRAGNGGVSQRLESLRIQRRSFGARRFGRGPFCDGTHAR